MNAFELSPTKILRQQPAVQSIGLHPLSWCFRYHRGKRHLLIGKVLAHVTDKMFHAIWHAQRFKQPLVIGKSYRDAPFVNVQPAKIS